jgi:hypothetical protein
VTVGTVLILADDATGRRHVRPFRGDPERSTIEINDCRADGTPPGREVGVRG